MQLTTALNWLDPTGHGFIRTPDGLCGFPHDVEETLTSSDLRTSETRVRLAREWVRIARADGVELCDIEESLDEVARIAEENGL